MCTAAALVLGGAALLPGPELSGQTGMQARAEPADIASTDAPAATSEPGPARAADAAPLKPAAAAAQSPARADVLSTATLGDGSDRGAKVPSLLFEQKSLIEQTLPMGGKGAGALASLSPPRGAAALPSTRPLEGKWAANAAACSDGKRRTNYLPLTIDARGAKAGAASCSFGTTEQNGNRWAIAAQCQQAGKRWGANVQLILNGRQLTWTSERGSQTYTRCP